MQTQLYHEILIELSCSFFCLNFSELSSVGYAICMVDAIRGDHSTDRWPSAKKFRNIWQKFKTLGILLFLLK